MPVPDVILRISLVPADNLTLFHGRCLTATLSSDEFENKKDQLISEPVFSIV
jgi:hypothetical protein